jgi:uncharacterized protein YsxB (DUF464 family)
MIQVQVMHGKDGLKGFKVKGHAGYEQAGRDIVCAGVSALAQTALLGLEEFLPNHFQWKIYQNGYIECHLEDGLSGQPFHDAQVILVTMLRGLESIKQQYEDYIAIALQEVK